MDQPIVFDKVSHVYNTGSPFAFHALDEVSVTIPPGKVTAIIGHTGSGKSTLIQHLNALMRPTSGAVELFGERITADSKHGSLKPLRKKVGVVFQFPESQLFEETVIKDVAFGPTNFGASEEEAKQIAYESLRLVGLDESLDERSPFDLSGGQMRRVAIAGVLAQEPEVLVLDEPTAGLDPLGHHQMMSMFMQLHRERNLTIVMVSHQMDDVAEYADHIIVMEKGRVVRVGTPSEIFSDAQWLRDRQLDLPHAMQFMERVQNATEGRLHFAQPPLTAKQTAAVLAQTYHDQLKNGGETADV